MLGKHHISLVTVLLVLSSTLMNQCHILNEVGLKRNTHKAGLCTGELTKVL